MAQNRRSPRQRDLIGSSEGHQKRQATVPNRSDTVGGVQWGTSSSIRGFPGEPECCSSPGRPRSCPEVAGSNPAPATKAKQQVRGRFRRDRRRSLLLALAARRQLVGRLPASFAYRPPGGGHRGIWMLNPSQPELVTARSTAERTAKWTAAAQSPVRGMSVSLSANVHRGWTPEVRTTVWMTVVLVSHL